MMIYQPSLQPAAAPHNYTLDSLLPRFDTVSDGQVRAYFAQLKPEMLTLAKALASKAYLAHFNDDWRPCPRCLEMAALDSHLRALLPVRPLSMLFSELHGKERLVTAILLRKRAVPELVDVCTLQESLARAVATLHRGLTLWRLGERGLDLHANQREMLGQNARAIEALLRTAPPVLTAAH